MATKTVKLAPQPGAREIAPVSIAVAAAVKALKYGSASPHQQQIALEWIVKEAGGKAHFPMHDTERDTCFALGRLFVADQIIGLTQRVFNEASSDSPKP